MLWHQEKGISYNPKTPWKILITGFLEWQTKTQYVLTSFVRWELAEQHPTHQSLSWQPRLRLCSTHGSYLRHYNTTPSHTMLVLEWLASSLLIIVSSSSRTAATSDSIKSDISFLLLCLLRAKDSFCNSYCFSIASIYNLNITGTWNHFPQISVLNLHTTNTFLSHVCPTDQPSTRHINLQNCLLIILHYRLISLQ